MSCIVELLEEKNQHLEKFFRLNEMELYNLSENNFENLENFYSSRECILDLVGTVDRRLNDLNSGIVSSEEITLENKKNIIKLLSYKNDLVQKILAQDLQILSIIEIEKSKVINELRGNKKARKAYHGYKVKGNSPSRLDEEI